MNKNKTTLKRSSKHIQALNCAEATLAGGFSSPFTRVESLGQRDAATRTPARE